MICFSLEKKYRGERAFGKKVHTNSHRMGARGNATYFPLPWVDLFEQHQNSEACSATVFAGGTFPPGEELLNFVTVLLQTADDGDNPRALARFAYQALVRREVLIELITEMRAQGLQAC